MLNSWPAVWAYIFTEWLWSQEKREVLEAITKSRLEAGWRQAGGRLEAGWRQADWRQAGRLEAG